MSDSELLLLASGSGSSHVDPSQIPLETLAKIRGSMWTARLNLPFGPRPNQDSNIIATDFMSCYSGTDKARIVEALKGRGYTHVVMGPVVDSDGYHGCYPPRDWSDAFDEWLDLMQYFWDHGLAPVVFIKPDNWTAADLETLTPLFQSVRAQRLIRICVPGGWEPSEDTSNAEWVRWVSWGARVLPNALRLIHMAADFDAPGNNDDFTQSSPLYIGMAEAWHRVVPYLHGYLVQNGGYATSGDEVPTYDFVLNFQAQFNMPRGLTDRFQNGYAGWPTYSAWGEKPLLVYAGEFAAYGDFWQNFDEHYARLLGDIALASGAAGSLDGCFDGQF